MHLNKSLVSFNLFSLPFTSSKQAKLYFPLTNFLGKLFRFLGAAFV